VAGAGTGDASGLTPPALLLVAATLVGWFAQRMQILTLGTAGQMALFEVRAKVFEKIVDLDVGYFESVESGDLMSRLINDIEQINSFLSQGFRRLLSSAFSLAATLVFMLIVEWRLALATLLVVPVMLGVTRLFGMIARVAFRKRQEAIGDVSATLAEELGGIKVAQAFNRTDRNRDAFTTRNAVNRDANIGAAVVSSAFSPVLAVISTAATALIAALGGWGAVRGLITIGVVVAFLNYARQFFNAVTQLSSLYSDTQSALAGGERVFQLLDTASEVADLPDAVVATDVRGRIEFSGVHFAYRTGPEILHGIDLDVSAGETVAIVGPTGAGKTTLINLAARFYDPTKGAVLLDGHDVRGLTLNSLRTKFGIVLQEPFLFSGTIADNIRYGRLDATDQDIRVAATAVGADEFIDRLDRGYDTVLHERGQNLSVGQRQLISFARAIVADPRILILDEATANVDTHTEKLIQRALDTMLKGRTSFVIAHRLSTIRSADQILVLDAGEIVERGTHTQLMQNGGLYRRLYEKQYGLIKDLYINPGEEPPSETGREI
jgi:ATP-binding cassette subfamily B protein/subfamily B ATP-binding cassette protein MsbA